MKLLTIRNEFRRCYASMPDFRFAEFKPKKFSGLNLEQQNEIRKERLNPALGTYYSTPLALHQGYKQWLFDLNGRRYLDMFGGICTVSVGHCHPKITSAVSEQLNTLCHVSNVYYHPKIHEYAQRLTEKFPGDLKVVYFVNSGSEANDLAVLLARAFTKRNEIITLRNCYHGMSYQTMALTSIGHYKYPTAQAGGCHNVVNPDVFRGEWGGNLCRDSPVQTIRSCDCGQNECKAVGKYVKDLEELLMYGLPKDSVAAFFAESIQGVGGTVQFPKGYLKKVVEIVRKNGGIFVSDEVQTGFGRTGDNFWGFEMHGIIPDVVTMAKGIGNGFPLGAVVTTPKIAAALNRAMHFNTYGGNPLSCAAGLAVLDVIEEEKLQENSKNVGTYLLLRLKQLRDKHEAIGDVRGKGLMIGVELVADKQTRNPISKENFMKIWERTRDLGLIVGKGGIHGNVFRIKPPMCVTKEDADFTVEVLDDALSTHSV